MQLGCTLKGFFVISVQLCWTTFLHIVFKIGPLENNLKVVLKICPGLAVAPLILMFKKEILKGATSKHAKQMYVGYETGQNNSDFKKNDIPLGGGATVSIFVTRTPQTST